VKFSKALKGEEKRIANQAQERLKKAKIKELKASNTLFNKKPQEERRVKRERVKKQREREKEKKAQEQA
jgi:hypothetical protein